jgi:hypothetical protein
MWSVDDYVTYSQDGWGTLGTAATPVLEANFFTVYIGGGVEIGIPGSPGFSMFFASPEAVEDYLPTNGTPSPLDADLLDPTSTSSGLFGGTVLALQLDVDFSDAGYLASQPGAAFGDLVLFDMNAVQVAGNLTIDFSVFEGWSVRQLLAGMNAQIGGGPELHNIDDVWNLPYLLGLAFEDGAPSAFAQGHLRMPEGRAVPEPSSALLTTLGMLTLGGYRRRCKRRAIAQLTPTVPSLPGRGGRRVGAA